MEVTLRMWPLALPAHDRQHRARHGEQAEDIGVELRADLVFLALFDGGLVAIAGIVYQHIDSPEALLRAAAAAFTWSGLVTSRLTASAVSRGPGRDRKRWPCRER